MPADTRIDPLTDAPASVGQRQLWLMDHYQGAGGALNCPVVHRLSGPLDVGRLGRALDTVVARHEALRTTFTGRGRRLARVVHEPRPVPLSVADLAGGPDPEAALAAALHAELSTRFDTSREIVRARLWRLGPDEHVLCLNQHHLVTDAWSCAVVSRELGEAYGGAELPDVAAQFSDFVRAESVELAGDRLARLQGYWRTQLDGVRVPQLPTPEHRAPAGERRIDFARAHLSPQVRARIAATGRAHRSTPFAVLLGAFTALLHEYAGQTDLAVASLLANRSGPELAGTVGYLANMVLLRTRFPDARTSGDVVAAARGTVVGALVHQALPYQLLPLDTIHADSVRDVVFQVFAEATHQTAFGGDSGLVAEPVDPPDGVGTRFDLDCVVMPHRDGGLDVVLGHATDRFDGEWAAGFVGRFGEIVTGLAGSPAGTPLVR